MAADIDAGLLRELCEPAERDMIGATLIEKADAQRRRLAGRGVVDTDVNGEHGLIH